MLSADDATVLPINGIGYFLALREQKVPATLHVYPTGVTDGASATASPTSANGPASWKNG